MKAWILGGLAAWMAAGCGLTGDKRTASDDPCLHMKAEARTASRLQEDIRRLTGEIRASEDRDSEDRAVKVEAEALRAYKRGILAQTLTSMHASARACDARKRPFDRYRTPAEREENRF